MIPKVPQLRTPDSVMFSHAAAMDGTYPAWRYWERAQRKPMYSHVWMGW
jgi:hypothetical protein